MRDDDWNEMLQKQLALISAMQRREESLRNLINEELQKLRRSIELADGRISSAAESAADRVVAQARQGLDQSVERLDERLDSSARQSRQASETQIKVLSDAFGVLNGKVMLASYMIAAAALLILGAAIYFAVSTSYYAKESKRLRIEVQWLERVNNADLVPCGGGLCANIDLKGEKVGENRKYVPVKLKPR